jgi:hypothetical protein
MGGILPPILFFCRFVADFIGTMSFMPGEVIEVLHEQNAVSVRTEFLPGKLKRYRSVKVKLNRRLP